LVSPPFCHWHYGNVLDKHKGTKLLTYFPDRECFDHISAIYVTVAEEITVNGFQRKRWSCKPLVSYFKRKRLHFNFLPTFCTYFSTKQQHISNTLLISLLNVVTDMQAGWKGNSSLSIKSSFLPFLPLSLLYMILKDF
jgi:hypothetical protein